MEYRDAMLRDTVIHQFLVGCAFLSEPGLAGFTDFQDYRILV